MLIPIIKRCGLIVVALICAGVCPNVGASTGTPVTLVLSNAVRSGGVTTTLQTNGTLRVTLQSVNDANVWNSTLRWTIPGAHATGEVVWLRMVASNQGPDAINFPAMVEQNVAPYPKIAQSGFRFITSSNEQIAMGIVTNAIPTNNAQVVLHLGQLQGTLYISQLQLVKHPAGTSTSALPQSPIVWEGMESNAAWRATALSNILARRTSTMRIRAVDPLGQPLSGVPVTIHQRNHRFAFGTAVNAQALLRTNFAHQAIYTENLAQDFQWGVIENSLKWWSMDWPGWEPGTSVYDFGPPAVARLREMGLKQRGHMLLWAAYNKSPAYLQGLTTAQLAAEIETHIRDEARRYAGIIDDWDVLNEPIGSRDFISLLGSNLIRNAFIWARQEDPHARLTLNENNILSEPRLATTRKTEFFNMIKWLRDSGAPIGGIGMQGHFCLGGPSEANKVPGINQLRATLDWYGSLGLPIRITEFDHDIKDEAVQAAYLRDLLTLLFSHQMVDGFIMWGFWDGWQWKGNSPFYHKDWTEKPALDVWRSLVHGAWWTDQRIAVTDTNGWAEFTTAFHGDYHIAATGFHANAVAHAPGVTSATLTQTTFAAWLDQHGLTEDQLLFLNGEWHTPYALFVMGADPAGDGSDLPRGQMARPGDAEPHVTIWGHSGRVYRLQWSADLTDSAWHDAGSVTSSASDWIDWPAPAATSAYFRIGIELEP
jgi:GH35 family endo-1,4-beta-xylanase